jgi:hypothetical protein
VITAFVINLVLLPIQALIDQLPTASTLGLNTWATDIVANIPGLGWANDYFPLAAMVSAITAIVACLAIMAIVNIGLWIYHQFPTVGGGNG